MKLHCCFECSLMNSTKTEKLYLIQRRSLMLGMSMVTDILWLLWRSILYFCVVRSVKSKADISNVVLRFVKNFEKQNGRLSKTVPTNGDSEFSWTLAQLEEDRVEVSMRYRYMPQSNGLVHRTRQTITDLAHTCLQEPKIPESYCSYAIQNVI